MAEEGLSGPAQCRSGTCSVAKPVVGTSAWLGLISRTREQWQCGALQPGVKCGGHSPEVFGTLCEPLEMDRSVCVLGGQRAGKAGQQGSPLV